MLRALARGDTSRAPAPAAPVPRIPALPDLSLEDGSSPALPLPVEAQAGAPAPAGDPSEAGGLRARNRPGLPPPLLPTPAATRTTPPTPSGSVALSAAGTVLLEVLTAPGSERGPVVRPAGPLLDGPPRDPARLADTLRTAVAHSGLFYESHVARWVAGDYPAADLALEPQAAGRVPGEAAVAAQAPAADAAAPTPAQTALLRAQIEAHEAHRLVVNAQVWPGQAAQIEFEENGHTREHTGEAAAVHEPPAWTAQIDLDLPSLGHVHLMVGLRGDAVHCRLTSPSADAVARLGRARDDLTTALAGQAFVLAHCTVHHES
ncbi:MAG: flagellar hook-length control protein FliK [Casimicrobiaceae bacterium]